MAGDAVNGDDITLAVDVLASHSAPAAPMPSGRCRHRASGEDFGIEVATGRDAGFLGLREPDQMQSGCSD